MSPLSRNAGEGAEHSEAGEGVAAGRDRAAIFVDDDVHHAFGATLTRHRLRPRRPLPQCGRGVGMVSVFCAVRRRHCEPKAKQSTPRPP